MLEFATKCPPPASLWKTLSAEPISPSQGYSTDQIRFMMFMDLSLSTDFTVAKNRSNNILRDISILSVVYSSLHIQLKSTYNLDFSPTDFHKLKPIEDMTDVVLLDNLDIPSIFIRQFLYGKDISTSMKLIADLFHIDNTHTYMDHLVVDISVVPAYITMYQLNTSEPFQYFDIFTIDSALPSRPIKCKDDISLYMRDTLADAINTLPSMMYDIDAPLPIPEFTLTVPSTETPTPYKEYPTALSWDDMRVGTKLRCIELIGDRTVGCIYVITEIANRTVWLSNDTTEPSVVTNSISDLPEYFTIEEI